jgi:HME family heavy-metal exporter
MLRRLIAWSINRSPFVLVSAALLMAIAGALLGTMPVDVFPELNAPTVVLLTEAGGLTAEEVEQQVTYPIESAMTGLPGVRRVRSASATSLSLIWVEFDWGGDIYRARQLVAEKLAGVRGSLPEATHSELGPVSSIAGEVMLISLSSPTGTVSDLELRALAEFTLRPGLLAVPGVSQVVALGGQMPEYQVHVRQARLLSENLAFADVVAATQGAHSSVSAGYLPDVGGEERPIQQMAQVRSPADVQSTIVRFEQGVPLTIGAVAEVALGGAPRRGTGSFNGHPAVVLTIQKSPGTNTLAITEVIDRALDPMEAALPEGVVLDRDAFRQAHFIKTAVDNLQVVVRDAVIIVVIILILFLLNIRATLITLTAMPLSLAVSVIAMWALDMSINVMTLGGLAVAIGALVDDAIIDVENVVRRLRENETLPSEQKKPFLHVLFLASDEIRSAVVFATVIICIVFIPLLLMQGLEGRFFRPLAFSYIVAVLASLVVALTVTPALCKHLLRRVGGAEEEGFLVRWLKRIYEPTLLYALNHRWRVLGATVVLTVGALLLSSTFGSSFLPQFNEGSFTVFVTAPPGTSLIESDRLGRGIERSLTQVEGVLAVTRRTGRAERDEHAEPVWSSEMDITLEPGESRDAAQARVSRVLESVAGVTTTVGQPIEHRLSHILSGTPAAIAVNVFGDDLPTLRRVAKEVESAMAQIPGARDVAANREVLVRALPIRYDRVALGRYGLTPAAAAEQVSEALGGAVTGQVRDGLRVYDLVVRLAPDERRTRADVENLILRGSSGAMVRLRDVARVEPDEAPYLIARQDGRRKAVISANVRQGHNLGHVIAAVRAAVDPLAAKYGVSVQYGGQFEAQQSASRSLAIAGAAVLLLVLMLLNVSLGSFRGALLVAVNLPLGLIGGIAAVYISESPGFFSNTWALFTGGGDYVAPVLSVASLVGFVTLFGIAVRNGILLVNHYAWLQENEGLDIRTAVIRGSAERLVPILMTALTAVLGLFPLAMASGLPGSELLAPLAIVVLGGLASSTFLNLVVVPAGYLVVFEGQGFTRRIGEQLVLDGNANLVEGEQS